MFLKLKNETTNWFLNYIMCVSYVVLLIALRIYKWNFKEKLNINLDYLEFVIIMAACLLFILLYLWINSFMKVDYLKIILNTSIWSSFLFMLTGALVNLLSMLFSYNNLDNLGKFCVLFYIPLCFLLHFFIFYFFEKKSINKSPKSFKYISLFLPTFLVGSFISPQLAWSFFTICIFIFIPEGVWNDLQSSDNKTKIKALIAFYSVIIPNIIITLVFYFDLDIIGALLITPNHWVPPSNFINSAGIVFKKFGTETVVIIKKVPWGATGGAVVGGMSVDQYIFDGVGCQWIKKHLIGQHLTIKEKSEVDNAIANQLRSKSAASPNFGHSFNKPYTK